jgi:hypothetical protein
MLASQLTEAEIVLLLYFLCINYNLYQNVFVNINRILILIISYNTSEFNTNIFSYFTYTIYTNSLL